jgi:hypothetical protein
VQRLIPFLSENAAWLFHGKPTIPAEEIRVATSARVEIHWIMTFNSEFEVLMANSCLNHYHEEELKLPS